jgi:hypothetical protein
MSVANSPSQTLVTTVDEPVVLERRREPFEAEALWRKDEVSRGRDSAGCHDEQRSHDEQDDEDVGGPEEDARILLADLQLTS